MPVIYYTPKDVEHITRISVQLGRGVIAYIDRGCVETTDLVRDMSHFREIFEPFLRARIQDGEEGRYYRKCLDRLLDEVRKS